MFSQIKVMLRLEFQREWKKLHTLSGIALFLVASVFTSYMGIWGSGDFPKNTALQVLLWLLLIYTGFQNVYNTFMRERPGLFYYYYQLVSPEVFVGVKLFLNSLLGLLASQVAFGLFVLILDFEVLYPLKMSLALLLGSLGIAGVLTLNAALAAKADGNATLMAVLSFPLLLPVLFYAIKLGLAADDPVLNFGKPAWVLASLDVLIGFLVLLLYPFLWRE